MIAFRTEGRLTPLRDILAAAIPADWRQVVGPVPASGIKAGAAACDKLRHIRPRLTQPGDSSPLGPEMPGGGSTVPARGFDAMRKLLLAAALAGTAIGGAALAQTTPPPAPPRGEAMRGDTDGDGRVSRAEAIAEADARFDRLDVDHDGKLSPDELTPRGRRGTGDRPAAPPPPAGADAPPPPPPPPPPPGGPMGGGRMLQRLDTDGDGTVSRAEYRAQAIKRFDRLDANHDGFIDQSEMDAVRDRMLQLRDRRDPPAGGNSALSAPPPPPNGGDMRQNPGQ